MLLRTKNLTGQVVLFWPYSFVNCWNRHNYCENSNCYSRSQAIVLGLSSPIILNNCHKYIWNDFMKFLRVTTRSSSLEVTSTIPYLVVTSHLHFSCHHTIHLHTLLHRHSTYGPNHCADLHTTPLHNIHWWNKNLFHIPTWKLISQIIIILDKMFPIILYNTPLLINFTPSFY